MIFYNLRDLIKRDGVWAHRVDFITDVVDLCVNPHYTTYESMYVTRYLASLGICEFNATDGWVTLTDTQYITMELYDPEDVVTIKLYMDVWPDPDRLYEISTLEMNKWK